MKRIIFVVSRNQRADLLPRLLQQCHDSNAEIIVDRRFGERRRNSEPRPFSDRRRVERRVHPNSSNLLLIGIDVVILS